MPLEIIAEAGVNHNGREDMALGLIDAAKAAGADCVKFQTFVPSEVISRRAGKAEYQKQSTDPGESMLQMVTGLRLDLPTHHRLLKRCEEVGIAFLSSPFDLRSIALLVHELGCSRLKIPSGEVTNLPYLLAAARSGCSLVVSSGMSRLAEVEQALGALAFGYLEPEKAPSLAACAEAYVSVEGQQALRNKVTLLHCTTEYPTPFEDVNLRAVDTMRSAFGLPVGLSDHTPGIAIAMAAAAREAAVIEKHFTLDTSLPGPDHKASIEPDELTALVEGVRAVEAALGDGVKRPAPSEIKNISIARKCLVARTTIAAGEPFTEANLAVKRCAGPISPEFYWDWLGRAAGRDYEPDEAIEN